MKFERTISRLPETWPSFMRPMYGGGKSQTSTGTSSVSIPPEVLSRYSAVNQQAQTVAQTPFEQYSADPNAFVAPLSPTQEAGIVGTNQYSTTAQPYYQTASNLTMAGSGSANAQPLTSSSINQYENPYLADVVGPTSQLLEQQYGQAQSGQEGNAIQEGAFGGDRSAVAAANLGQQQSLAYGNTMGGLLNNAYTTALGTAQQQQGVNLSAEQANLARLTGAGSQEASIGAGAQSAGLAGAQAQLTAGQSQQETEQAGLTALYNQFLQQQSYPFQTTQFLGNIAEGTGALSGSTTASSSTSPAPFFSDERLKEDIEPIGETYDGTNIVKFRYKGSPHKQIGLIAQEVEKKHPEAVGLAGGYKTVDYDAATKDAVRSQSMGGLAAGTGRKAYAYGGLSPNSAWDAGFYVDPSYLASQEQSYANAPWSGAGPVNANIPGKGRNIPAGSGVHGALAVAQPAKPPPQQQNGLQQISQGLGAAEKLGQQGKSLWSGAKGLLGGNTSPTSPTSGGLPSQPAGGGIAPPVSPPAGTGSGGIGAADAGSTAVPDAGSDMLASVGPQLADDVDLGSDIMDGLAARGGLIGRHHYDSGGTPVSYNQPTDADSDDQSSGGDIPFESGTGMSGLDIPDERNNNKLAVAPPPQSSSSGGGGGFNPMSLVGPVLGIFGLARGGLAAGGDPDADALAAASSIPVPASMDFPASPGPIASSGRDVHAKPASPQGLAGSVDPDLPTPDAEAVQAVTGRGGLAPVDYSSSAGDIVKPTVKVPDKTPGLSDALSAGRGWFGQNQDWLVPLMHGLGTMASSNSRYLGSAVLQGLGGAADSYENTQNEMMNRGLTGAEQVGTLARAGETQADTGNVQANTTNTQLQNEGLRQAQAHGDYFSAGGQDYVTIDDGTGKPRNVLAGQWMLAGMPPTYHQVHTAAGNAPQPGKPNVPSLGIGSAPAGSPGGPTPAGQPSQRQFGSVGAGGLTQADTDFQNMIVNPQYRVQQKQISDDQEKGMAAAAQSAITQKQILNQAAENLARFSATGQGAPGAMNSITAAAAYRWNGLVDAFAGGNPALKVDGNNIAGTFTQEKLQAMQEFARAHGNAQNSLGALEAASYATPSAAMDPQTQQRVLASLYVDNQQDIDKWNYLNDYKRYIQSKGGAPFSQMYTTQGAMTGFGNDHKLERYGPEEKALEGVFGTTANGVPLVTRYQNGELDPKRAQAVEQHFHAPGLFRYFGGGQQ